MKNKILCIISTAAPFFIIWGISYAQHIFDHLRATTYFAPGGLILLELLLIGACMMIYPIATLTKIYPSANISTAVCLLIGGIIPVIFVMLYLFTAFPFGILPAFHVIGDLPWSLMAGAYLLFDVFIAVKIFKREKQV